MICSPASPDHEVRCMVKRQHQCNNNSCKSYLPLPFLSNAEKVGLDSVVFFAMNR